MKTIRFIESTFHINEENRVVVCELWCDMGIIDSPIWPYLECKIWNHRFPNVNGIGKFKVTAKARCHIDDTFNPEFGKKLAYARAELKAYSIAKRVWILIRSYFKNLSIIALSPIIELTAAEEDQKIYLCTE